MRFTALFLLAVLLGNSIANAQGTEQELCEEEHVTTKPVISLGCLPSNRSAECEMTRTREREGLQRLYCHLQEESWECKKKMRVAMDAVLDRF